MTGKKMSSSSFLRSEAQTEVATTRHSTTQAPKKSEIRNPKSETNPDDRNPKQEAKVGKLCLSDLKIRISNLFRASDFVLRIFISRYLFTCSCMRICHLGRLQLSRNAF